MTTVRSLCVIAAFVLTLAGGLNAQQPVPPAAPKVAVATSAAQWPRTFSEDGLQITLHQPQLDDWQGNTLSGRLAVAVKTGTRNDSEGKPHDTLSYGAMFFKARAEVDKSARTVSLSNVSVQRVSFPTDRDNEAKYTQALGKIARAYSRVVSLDVLEAALAINRETRAMDSIAVKNDPPDVLFWFEPALLVLIDGTPVLKPSAAAGVDRIVNTRSLILKQGERYYLSLAGHWASATDLAGPWTTAPSVPAALDQARTAAEKSKVVDLLDKPSDALKKVFESGKLPAILVSSKPAELIMVDGDPDFVDIPQTSLAYVANTTSDVFIDKSHDNFWYALISGRWFAAPSSNGPWTYVSGKVLPADFAKIPPDSPKSAALASIPGTPEARESLIANSIPQTATVKRSEASLKVEYDGAPQFKPIEDTPLHYAWNTAVPVIQIAADNYYAVQNGIWFGATMPQGPWSVATTVPPIIYSIPASSPLHYVTYVHVYGTSGDDLYVGYTPGYYGTIVSDGTVVYGTGYACDPWIGEYWYGCPATYGFNVDFGYDPYVGWTFGFGWGWGWSSAWYGPWWGPWGYWSYPAYWPGYWGGGIVAGSIYGRWGNSVVSGVGAGWANPWTGNYGRAGSGGYRNEKTGGAGYGYAARNTNVYTGTTTAAAGGMRYNPQTGRVVAGQGSGAYNSNTGNAVAGGSRTTVNTNTGRVTESAGAAGRNANGAGAVGGFNSEGAGGDAKGAGYVKYDRASGDVSSGGVANINDSIYAGKDGNVYKYDKGEGWQPVGNDTTFNNATDLPGNAPTFNRASDLSSAGNLDNDRYARDRGADRAAERTSRGGGGRDFDRGSYGGGFQGGRMGGYRPATIPNYQGGRLRR